MIKMYNTDINTNITEETKDLKKGNWINMISPTEEEIQRVCAALQIKQDFIRYSLDEEEKARIDTEDDDNTTLYIIDIPVIESDRTRRVYVTMPIGVIFVRDDYIITVSQKNNDIIKDTVDNTEYSFCGTITQVEKNLFFVEPDEGEEIRKSSDLIMIGKLKLDTNVIKN